MAETALTTEATGSAAADPAEVPVYRAEVLVYDDARPGRFWSLMGPLFASEKVRRELPYLADRPDRVWVVVTTDGNTVAGFACADPGEDAVLREAWAERGADGAGVEAARTALRYLTATGALRVRATVKGRAVGILIGAGFAAAGAKGSYRTLEARP